MKKSLPQILSTLTYLPDRKPEMAFTSGAEAAFAEKNSLWFPLASGIASKTLKL